MRHKNKVCFENAIHQKVSYILNDRSRTNLAINLGFTRIHIKALKQRRVKVNIKHIK